jgi:arsenate reductase (thioredoxin)
MSERRRVLILCTGNSARSQMAEGLLREMAGEMFDVASAGVSPSFVRPEAIAAMREIGIISQHRSKPVDEFMDQEFDYVITVCDNAREQCPIFPGQAQRIHWSFDDPAAAEGDEFARLAVFRRVRDEIKERLRLFVADEMQKQSPLACDMTAIAPDERPKHLATSRELFSRIEEFRELPNGYEFRLAQGPNLISKLAEFVSLEKLCCPFLNFVIEIEAERGPVWLRLTGRDGVKAFIREEIAGLTGFTGFTRLSSHES